MRQQMNKQINMNPSPQLQTTIMEPQTTDGFYRAEFRFFNPPNLDMRQQMTKQINMNPSPQLQTTIMEPQTTDTATIKPPLPTPPPPHASLAWSHFTTLRHTSPLIQCITNYVSMDLMANTLLAAGASPAMIHAVDEIPDFTPHVNALCINVGTLTPNWLPAMKVAVKTVNELKKPWVLDPVAAGSSGFRLRACVELMGLRPTVVRGNASEIIALHKGALDANSRGADSVHESTDAVAAAKSLAQISGSIIAVSGAVDIITDGQRVFGVKNGVPMLQKITATGCSVTALIAAFVAIDPSHPFEATTSALSIFGVAGEVGMIAAKGPASLRMHLVDSLHTLDEHTFLQLVNITTL